MSPAAVRECAAQRFGELYDELCSRAWAANWDLSPCDREDAVQEACCHAWSWLLSAARKGRIDKLTAYSLARYARLQFRSGRRFGTSANIRDVLSLEARARGKVNVVSLGDVERWKCDGSVRGRAVSEALVDSRVPRPDTQCRVDHDYMAALAAPSLPSRTEELFAHLLADHGPGCGKRIAEAMAISAPRVTQIKAALGEALIALEYGPRRGPDRVAA